MPQSADAAADTGKADADAAAAAVKTPSKGSVAAVIDDAPPERDEFGLPVRKRAVEPPTEEEEEEEEGTAAERGEHAGKVKTIVKRINGLVEHENAEGEARLRSVSVSRAPVNGHDQSSSDSEDEEFTEARSTVVSATQTPNNEPDNVQDVPRAADPNANVQEAPSPSPPASTQVADSRSDKAAPKDDVVQAPEQAHKEVDEKRASADQAPPTPSIEPPTPTSPIHGDITASKDGTSKRQSNGHMRGTSSQGQGISEWSHQQLAPHNDSVEEKQEEDEWQTMPAYAPYDIYDDDNRLVAREQVDSDDEKDVYAGLGGAGRGYTRVQLDEDAQSATSLDDNTKYLFKDSNAGTGAGELEDEEQRDAVSQLQATKDLLTEGQRIAYVGMTRLILSDMLREAEMIPLTRGTKKELRVATEAMKMWSQKMMVRLYAHMEISTAEQVMIEQLADHGVVPSDLTSTLMQNARVKNPMAEQASSAKGMDSPRLSISSRPSISSPRSPGTPRLAEEPVAEVPPPYVEHEGDDLPEVQLPSQLPTTASIDIDLRWTVLCDLFLTLIADSIYDSRSRVLLERVGANMQVDWLEICRFEKRVTDALEMQQAAEKENWNEDEHKETRRKAALKKRYMMMGLATVGGSLVIGLSAGLLAPVIGAGLAAGFTTIGVAGTSGFLAGAGGAAIITSAAATSGGVIAVRAANRRTGAVKTFEYRPLHNNKRVNLIVTVSGWMTGKVDDVRLPYSTVDPIMGDIYSVLWEPEMLRSMGDTINILATEALTQGLQQVLGSTILIGLMAALQLPVVLTKLAYLIDNPWTVSLDRANMAGLILADSLIDRNLGTRPITFVGYSLGSRVIFSCLRELARKGAYGLVQNVYLFGSPIVAKKDEYLKARSVVAGRFVNGYATNDWILGYLFRLTSGGISRVAGLAPIEDVPGLENLNVTELVPGHMAYRTAMPRLLREAGWMVESDEFTEIEDPDPENHAQRQRELINEIEEARKEFDKKEKESKGKFGFFSRRKKERLEKKEWETYEENKGEEGQNSDTGIGRNDGVLFDIDAIRAELQSEMIEVKELKSTLPPMKLDLGSPTVSNPRDSLRETRSYDAALLSGDPHKTSFTSPPLPSIQREDYDDNDDLPPIRNLDVNPRSRDEDTIQMTFDTAYHSPALSATPSYNSLPPPNNNSNYNHSSSSTKSFTPPPQADPSDRAATPQRPELRNSNTLPIGLGLGSQPQSRSASSTFHQPSTMDLERNAWADDDDDDFGKEKEIQMTFA